MIAISDDVLTHSIFLKLGLRVWGSASLFEKGGFIPGMPGSGRPRYPSPGLYAVGCILELPGAGGPRYLSPVPRSLNCRIALQNLGEAA